MRVLHVLDAACARPTDYGRRTQALLAALRAQGVQTVHLSAPSAHDGDGVLARRGDPGPASPPDAWPSDVWHLYRTPPSRLPPWLGRPCRDVAAAVSLAFRLREVAHLTRPDLIHVHPPGSHAAAAWPMARLARMPLVVDVDRRTALGQGASALARFAYVRAHAVAAPSADMRATLCAAGVPPRRIAILPPPIDVQSGVRHAVRARDTLDAPLLAYAGDLDRADGIDLLLDALRDLRRRCRTLRLLIAGGGRRTEALEARIAAYGLGGYVHVTGRLAGRRTADVMARADVAVFPALPNAAARTPSRHLLQAMASGCAVVASDIACHRDVLVHGHSGMLFAAGSRAALVDVLAQLLEQTCRLRALGLAAARSAAATHDWTATATRYRRLYETILMETRRRRSAGR
jgi:glycosyltransferase involved in cell wall biosynthesis